MHRIPQDVLDRVLALHDIVEVVGRSLPLTKAGRAYKALCPFHDEKTPSFTVNPDRQTFKCFGCGKGGNVFGWLMEREGVTFREAVTQLAEEKGVALPSAPRGEPAPDVSRTQSIRRAIAFAQDLFVRTLWGPEGDHARAYLEKRGFPPPASRAFGLGLSPDGWEGLRSAARAAGFDDGVLEDAGLVVRRDDREDGGRERRYDRFRARLMFPIADVSGRIVTYGARALKEGDTPKYLNGPETPVFRKGRTLYALDRAKDGMRRDGHAILMEGYTDVLVAHLFGFASAVAGMGTALTPEQAQLLARHTRRVVLLYDGDDAGLAAAEKALDVFVAHDLEVRVALLPDGRDVDEVLLEDGSERLDEIVRSAADGFDFKLARLGAAYDLASDRGRALAASALAELLGKVKNPVERDLRSTRLAEQLGVSERLLRAESARGTGRPGRPTRGPASPGAGLAGGAGRGPGPGGGLAGGPAPGAQGLDEGDLAEAPAADPREAQRAYDLWLEQVRLVAGCVFAPAHLPAVRQEMPPGEIGDEGLRRLYEAVLALADAGHVPGPEALARSVAGDPSAASALAGLPDDLRFEDWVPDALRHRQGRRTAAVRRQTVLKWLAEPAVPAQNLPPPGRTEAP